MKKLLSLFLMLIVASSVYAQKSYIVIHCSCNQSTTKPYMYLSGDVPQNVESEYLYGEKTIGNVLNLLSASGFVVEQMTSSATSYRMIEFLLSKNNNPTPGAIQTIDSDEEVTEVARYNLQGQPIREDEPGVQIIVFSNYTSKVVIKQ